MLAWLTGSVQHQHTEHSQQHYRMYCIPKHKFKMAYMLAWLTGSVQHQQAEQGQQHYHMYCIPKHKFNMAEMLAWLTGSVQNQQAEQGQQEPERCSRELSHRSNIYIVRKALFKLRKTSIQRGIFEKGERGGG